MVPRRSNAPVLACLLLGDFQPWRGRGLQRTAETCGGGGSSGIDDKARHVGLRVHSLTSEGFGTLVWNKGQHVI